MTTEVYVASNMPYDWPGKLQHAGYANERIRATCETYIADSDINDPDSGNAAVLELATELDADYMLPADTLGDPEATATAVAEFRDLRPQYDTDATTLYPLQPPHLRAWRDAGCPEHVAVGGVRDAAASTVIRVLESLRDVRDELSYVHLLGVAKPDVLLWCRENPTVVDSLDAATPENAAMNGKALTRQLEQRPVNIPTGTGSTQLRAALARFNATVIQQLLRPGCDSLTPETTLGDF